MATSPAIPNKLQLDAGLCHVCHGQPVALCSKTLMDHGLSSNCSLFPLSPGDKTHHVKHQAG